MIKSQRQLLTLSLGVLFVLGMASSAAAQDPTGTPVGVTTWQQDYPAICTGTPCVERTGQNLAESGITYQNVKPSIFGLKCQIPPTSTPTPMDGQIYVAALGGNRRHD